jgi:hypothetical protein
MQSALRPNPFNTYRDPQTGYWITVVTTPTGGNAMPCQQSPLPRPPRRIATEAMGTPPRSQQPSP